MRSCERRMRDQRRLHTSLRLARRVPLRRQERGQWVQAMRQVLASGRSTNNIKSLAHSATLLAISFSHKEFLDFPYNQGLKGIPYPSFPIFPPYLILPLLPSQPTQHGPLCYHHPPPPTSISPLPLEGLDLSVNPQTATTYSIAQSQAGTPEVAANSGNLGGNLT